MLAHFMKCILLSGLLSIISFAHAASAPDELTVLLEGVRTMKADFVQTVYDNHNKPIQHADGHMALERPGKFRWEISKPIPQLIIANQSRLWIYDPDLAQVTVRSLQQATGETPALLLSHADTDLENEFNVKELKSVAKVRWFHLVPRNGDNFAAIELGFKNQQITEMRLQDHLGHTTHIQFKNINVNKSLTAATFVFKAPPNVDVIYEKASS